MVDVAPLAETVLAALETIPGITVHDGHVPAAVPETNGYIDPYVVLWAGVGDNPGEALADGRHDTDSLVWDFQVTVVAASPATCRLVGEATKALLTNLRIRTGRVKPNPDAFQQQAPILDTQTSPARFMLPLQWRLNTN